MKIYIAGKMTGLPLYNFEQFFYWAARLRAAGHEPANPAEHTLRKMFDGWVYDASKYDEVMEEDFALIRTCDGVLFMEGWGGSMGARAEYELAVSLDLPRYFVKGGDHVTALGCKMEVERVQD